MSKRKFFDERSDQSEVKARIVQKYFFAWANVIMPSARKFDGKIAYIDLFAGPGRYKDGSASTPLLVLEQAIAHPKLREMLVALFNDVDQNHTQTLLAEIEKLQGIDKLKHKPQVLCGAVDEDAEEYFTQTRLIPSFTFVDPFGYKGLSLKIVNGVIKDWGCDCVFFFNYNRINAGVTNPVVENHIDTLFGPEVAQQLRETLPSKTPQQREALILEALAQALKAMGGKFVLPFWFRNDTGKRTTHALIFVSKSFKGYEIMKGIMANESTLFEQGVPSLAYSPADKNTPLLFSLSRPLDDLERSLRVEFAERTLTMREIYEEHSVDTPYIEKNYKEALLKLEAKGKIKTDPAKRRKGTFADRVTVTFPSRKR